MLKTRADVALDTARRHADNILGILPVPSPLLGQRLAERFQQLDEGIAQGAVPTEWVKDFNADNEDAAISLARVISERDRFQDLAANRYATIQQLEGVVTRVTNERNQALDDYAGSPGSRNEDDARDDAREISSLHDQLRDANSGIAALERGKERVQEKLAEVEAQNLILTGEIRMLRDRTDDSQQVEIRGLRAQVSNLKSDLADAQAAVDGSRHFGFTAKWWHSEFKRVDATAVELRRKLAAVKAQGDAVTVQGRGAEYWNAMWTGVRQERDAVRAILADVREHELRPTANKLLATQGLLEKAQRDLLAAKGSSGPTWAGGTAEKWYTELLAERAKANKELSELRLTKEQERAGFWYQQYEATCKLLGNRTRDLTDKQTELEGAQRRLGLARRDLTAADHRIAELNARSVPRLRGEDFDVEAWAKGIIAAGKLSDEASMKINAALRQLGVNQ